MKKILLYITTLLLFAGIGTACSDWTETEEKDFLSTEQTDEYYAGLRAWKATYRDRQVSFGWFGNWTGVGASLQNCMAGLPDSIDVISLWGPWHPYTFNEKKRADFEYVRKVKGVKVMACSFTMNVGDNLTPEGVDKNEFWGWDATDPVKQEAAIRKYARAFADSVNAAGFDGFDIDHEPYHGGSGNLASYEDRMHIFIDELGKYFGPKSGTGKLLAIDGEPHSIAPESGPYFDYFIEQTYGNLGGSNSDTSLDQNRIKKPIEKFAAYMTPEEVAAKYICTENFESFAMAGGVSYTTRDGEIVQSLKGFAMWEPIYNGKLLRKGGCGTYHMEYEYKVADKSGFYPYMREAIQIMNSAQKK